VANELPPPFYNSLEMYQMNEHKKGRKPKYMTLERWEKWLSNDWYHLTREVAENKWLVRILLAALIAATLIDRLVG